MGGKTVDQYIKLSIGAFEYATHAIFGGVGSSKPCGWGRDNPQHMGWAILERLHNPTPVIQICAERRCQGGADGASEGGLQVKK